MNPRVTGFWGVPDDPRFLDTASKIRTLFQVRQKNRTAVLGVWLRPSMLEALSSLSKNKSKITSQKNHRKEDSKEQLIS
jgi:hypothetical protein